MAKVESKEPTQVPTPSTDKRLAVFSATLHQAISVNGMIGVERTLGPMKQPKMKMYWGPEGLWCELDEVRAIIPAANVAVVVLK